MPFEADLELYDGQVAAIKIGAGNYRLRLQFGSSGRTIIESVPGQTGSKDYTMANRDIVAIGASAGGVEALTKLVGGFPQDFPAALFVVMHLSPFSGSSLPKILSDAGSLKAFHPEDGETIRPGRIYVAPPDHHLLVEDQRVLVKNGPKENRFRPSVDALFRSVAYSYGNRVIGVVLTGALDDGTSGLWTIKRLGGLAIIQDPTEASFSQMPANVQKQVEVDYSVRLSEMAPLLGRLIRQRTGKSPKFTAAERKQLRLEVEIASHDNAFERGIMELGRLTPFTCPECHGALVDLKEGKQTRFRCHTGHAFSVSALLAGVTEANEEALWQAMRGLEEATMLLNHIGEYYANATEPKVAKLFFKKARENGKRARVIHESLMEQERLSEDLRHGNSKLKGKRNS